MGEIALDCHETWTALGLCPANLTASAFLCLHFQCLQIFNINLLDLESKPKTQKSYMMETTKSISGEEII